MTDSLTLSAQAVIDAYDRAPVDNKRSVAAVLRAVADQVVPDGGVFLSTASAARTRAELLAIAAELEAQP